MAPACGQDPEAVEGNTGGKGRVFAYKFKELEPGS